LLNLLLTYLRTKPITHPERIKSREEIGESSEGEAASSILLVHQRGLPDPVKRRREQKESETGNRCGEIGKGEENRMAHPLSPRMMTFRSILRRVAMDLGDRTQRDETRGAEGMDGQIPLLLGNLYFSPACQLVSSVGALGG
jgi:hypothetical protein